MNEVIHLPLAKSTVRQVVETTIIEVAAEQGRTLPVLSDDLLLINTGLDSLCLAVIVARLEDSLAVDPFGAADEAALPTTVGDFVRLYEAALR